MCVCVCERERERERERVRERERKSPVVSSIGFRRRLCIYVYML